MFLTRPSVRQSVRQSISPSVHLLVSATPQKPLDRLLSYLVGLLAMMCRCAYYTAILIEQFFLITCDETDFMVVVGGPQGHSLPPSIGKCSFFQKTVEIPTPKLYIFLLPVMRPISWM